MLHRRTITFTSRLPALLVAAVVMSCGSGTPSGTSANAAMPARGPADTMPDRSWIGTKRVTVLCQVGSSEVIDVDQVKDVLCERVRALASRGAPVPVEIVGLGDASLQPAGTAVLVVHGSVEPVGAAGRMLTFTTRVERSGGLEPAPNYFGARPQLAPFESVAQAADWDEALTRSLSEVLPWLRPAEIGDATPIPKPRD